MKNRRRLASFGALALQFLFAGVSVAEGSNVWDGFYLGPQLGGVTNSGCSRWLLSGAGMNDTGPTESETCGSGSVAAGVVIGENFQYERFFWGISADIDFVTGKKTVHSWTSTGPNPPAGTYLDSERLSPEGLILIAPRVGYAGREWAPYLRAGGLVAFGGQDSSTAYIPPGGTQSTVGFNGGKSFNTIGWAAGGGIELGLHGPWSIAFEYMHANLGRGSSSSAGCAGTTTACEGFSGPTFENVHDAITINMYRIGVNYYFNFW
jgi:opacity protein-like surface antigen